MIYALPQIPSYGRGFARCAAESAYPNLWKGLLGLWAPYLGPTGLTLYDWSGYGRHGTLTDMDPATDWVASPHGSVLDFDGADDQVAVVPKFLSVAEWTIWALIRPDGGWDNSEAADDYAIEIGSNAENRSLLYLNDDGTIRHLSNKAGVVRIAATSQTSWPEEYLSIIGTSDAALVRVYVNGEVGATTAVSQGLGSITKITLGYDGIEDAGRGLLGRMVVAGLWNRSFSLSEIQKLYANPHALTTLRSKVIGTAAAPAGVAPTSHLYGPLVGPLGGAV